MSASPRRLKNGDLTFWRNRRRRLQERVQSLQSESRLVPSFTADALEMVGVIVRELEAASS